MWNLDFSGTNFAGKSAQVPPDCQQRQCHNKYKAIQIQLDICCYSVFSIIETA